MTTVQAIRNVKSRVKDESSTVWSVDEVLRRINDARRQLWREKNYAFYMTKIVVVEPVELTSMTAGNLDVIEAYSPALVAYAAYLLLMEGKREGDVDLAVAELNEWNRIVHPRGGRQA